MDVKHWVGARCPTYPDAMEVETRTDVKHRATKNSRNLRRSEMAWTCIATQASLHAVSRMGYVTRSHEAESTKPHAGTKQTHHTDSMWMVFQALGTHTHQRSLHKCTAASQQLKERPLQNARLPLQKYLVSQQVVGNSFNATTICIVVGRHLKADTMLTSHQTPSLNL